MKTIIALLTAVSLLALGGCAHTSAALKTKNVAIGINTKSGGGSAPVKSRGGFCPPGQAKKGNC